MFQEGPRTIPLNIPTIKVESKLLYSKILCLLYCFVNIFFTVCNTSYKVGVVKTAKVNPNLTLYNTAFLLLSIFKVINIFLMFYTKYFNYTKRNHFYLITKNGFIIYSIFFQSLVSGFVYLVMRQMQFYDLLWIKETFPLSFQYFLGNLFNGLFLSAVAVTLIEYSRWKFQTTFEDIHESEKIDLEEIVGIILLNRYNILITIIGLIGLLIDELSFYITTTLLELCSKYYKVDFILRTPDSEINKKLIIYFPCFIVLSLVSIFYLIYRIKDYWYFVRERKEFERMSNLSLSHLNLSNTTIVSCIVIVSISLGSIIKELHGIRYFLTDTLRILLKILGTFLLVLLLISMKNWKRVKRTKPLSDQLFIYSGYVGVSMININYFIIAIKGLQLFEITQEQKIHFTLALVEAITYFFYKMLMFLFNDVSLTKIHIHRGNPERFNSLSLLLSSHLSLMVISFNKYFYYTDKVISTSFVEHFNSKSLLLMGYPFALLYEVYFCGYCGLRIFRWYGIFEKSSNYEVDSIGNADYRRHVDND